MLSNLLNLLQVPGSQENQYVMKGKAFNTIVWNHIVKSWNLSQFFGDLMMAVWLLLCIHVAGGISHEWFLVVEWKKVLM